MQYQDLKKKILEPMISNMVKYLDFKPELDISLLGGDFGSVLSLYYASKHGLCTLDVAHKMLDKVLSAISKIDRPSLTYCDGLTGICIGLKQLEDDEFLAEASDSGLSYLELLARHLQSIQQSNLDFLHGGIGMAMYFLQYPSTQSCVEVIERYILNLYSSAIHQKNGGIFWKFPNRLNGLSENLSLSHGMSAVVMFLARSQKMQLSRFVRELSLDLLLKIGKYIIQFIVSPTENGSFTPMVPTNNGSRLGWCYGDVGTSTALKAISELCHDDKMAALAYKIALHAALNRRELLKNSIFDACICHGASGLIPFFDQCYRTYKDDCFLETREYWRKTSIELASPFKGFRRFDYFFPPAKARLFSYNILEGDAGVTLALLNENQVLSNLLLLNHEV